MFENHLLQNSPNTIIRRWSNWFLICKEELEFAGLVKMIVVFTDPLESSRNDLASHSGWWSHLIVLFTEVGAMSVLQAFSFWLPVFRASPRQLTFIFQQWSLYRQRQTSTWKCYPKCRNSISTPSSSCSVHPYMHASPVWLHSSNMVIHIYYLQTLLHLQRDFICILQLSTFQS